MPSDCVDAFYLLRKKIKMNKTRSWSGRSETSSTILVMFLGIPAPLRHLDKRDRIDYCVAHS